MSILLEMRELLDEHNLYGWKAEIKDSRSWHGLCDYSKKTIYLSLYLSLYGTGKQIRNTILHEIAHALTAGHCHDKVWKAKAIEIGCDGKRCNHHGFEHLIRTR